MLYVTYNLIKTYLTELGQVFIGVRSVYKLLIPSERIIRPIRFCFASLALVQLERARHFHSRHTKGSNDTKTLITLELSGERKQNVI